MSLCRSSDLSAAKYGKTVIVMELKSVAIAASEEPGYASAGPQSQCAKHAMDYKTADVTASINRYFGDKR